MQDAPYSPRPPGFVPLRPFTKARRRRGVPALQVLQALPAPRGVLQSPPVLQVPHDVLRIPQGHRARAGHRPRTVGHRVHQVHQVRNQEAALAAGPVGRGGGGGDVVAAPGEEAAGRGGDVSVASRAVGDRDGGDGGVVAAAEGEGVLRGRDEACGGGVLGRRPF